MIKKKKDKNRRRRTLKNKTSRMRNKFVWNKENTIVYF